MVLQPINNTGLDFYNLANVIQEILFSQYLQSKTNNSKKSYKFSKVKPKPPRTPKVRPSPTFNSTIRVALLDYIINQ